SSSAVLLRMLLLREEDRGEQHFQRREYFLQEESDGFEIFLTDHNQCSVYQDQWLLSFCSSPATLQQQDLIRENEVKEWPPPRAKQSRNIFLHPDKIFHSRFVTTQCFPREFLHSLFPMLQSLQHSLSSRDLSMLFLKHQSLQHCHSCCQPEFHRSSIHVQQNEWVRRGVCHRARAR